MFVKNFKYPGKLKDYIYHLDLAVVNILSHLLYIYMICIHTCGLPQRLSGKESTCSAGDTRNAGSIFKKIFIYLFTAVLSLHCCMQASPVARSGGHSVDEEHRLLTAVASPCGGAQALGCSGFGS